MTIDNNKYGIALANSGLSTAEVAAYAGMSRQRLATILNQKNVTPHACGKVARALNVRVEEIIVTDN